jgi:hypothetical protein
MKGQWCVGAVEVTNALRHELASSRGGMLNAGCLRGSTYQRRVWGVVKGVCVRGLGGGWGAQARTHDSQHD